MPKKCRDMVSAVEPDAATRAACCLTRATPLGSEAGRGTRAPPSADPVGFCQAGFPLETAHPVTFTLPFLAGLRVTVE